MLQMELTVILLLLVSDPFKRFSISSDKFREEFLGVGLLSTVQDVQSIVSPSNDKDTI